jgi:hypothetical protein
MQTLPKLDLNTKDGITEMETRVGCLLDGDIHDFRVIVEEKGIILQGQARTYHARKLAEDMVLEATEFPVSANEIEVW